MTAAPPSGSARPPTWPSMWRPGKCSRPMAMPTTGWRYSIPRPAPTSGIGAPMAKKPSDEKMPPYDPAKPPSQQLGNPVHCIRIDREGLVYVCDSSNNRMQIFRKDGSFVAEHVYEKATRGTGSVYD